MSELKRFLTWLIDNDIAFTHIDEAVKAFREKEIYDENKELYPFLGSDNATTDPGIKFKVY